MSSNNTTDFKIKRRTSNMTLKKIEEDKSESTKDDTFRNSGSMLKSNEVPSS
jgi:hypothetical protein